MKVKVIENKPDLTEGFKQDDILHLIGKEYNVISKDEDENSVNVYEASFGGEITLNEGEYATIEG